MIILQVSLKKLTHKFGNNIILSLDNLTLPAYNIGKKEKNYWIIQNNNANTFRVLDTDSQYGKIFHSLFVLATQKGYNNVMIINEQ